MDTKKLYVFDSYIKQCTARVVAVVGNEVMLSETPFYPGGGGQPCDTGRLESDGQTWSIAAVRKDDQHVWHTVAGTGLPAIGAIARVELDWDRRYLLMRTIRRCIS